MKKIYTHKRSIDVFYSLKKQTRLYLDDHMQFRTIDNGVKPKINILQPNFCYTNFIWFESCIVDFEIYFKLTKFKGRLNWFLIGKEQLQLKNKKKIKLIKTHYKDNNETYRITFNFRAKPDKSYAIMGQIAKPNFNNELNLSIDFLEVKAQIIETA